MVNTGFTFKVRQPVVGNAGPDGFAADIYHHGRAILASPTFPSRDEATAWGEKWCENANVKKAS